MNWKRCIKTKKKFANILKVFLFIFFAFLPFLTVTNMIGIDAFLDSFENPDSYVCLKDNGRLAGSNTRTQDYLIIQKISHPDFEIKEKDFIIFYENSGEISCNEVNYISTAGTIRKYYIFDENGILNEPIYEIQVVGKVIDFVDNNIWNSISLKIWETSINNLNLRAILTTD